MTTGPCEFIVNSTAKRGDPAFCGKPGLTFLIIGLGWVPATLCLEHRRAMVKRGYRVECTDPRIVIADETRDQ